MKWLSALTLALLFLLSSCKEFIEPSIAKRNVVQLAPAKGSEILLSGIM